jgi:alpha-N-arabinofuranosidase
MHPYPSPAILALFAALSFPASGAPSDSPVPLSSRPTLRIDAGQVTARVSPAFYGLMTEEINHSYDGGLYAELIQNRTFQDNADKPAHWSLIQAGTSAWFGLDPDHPLNGVLKTSLKLDAEGASPGSRVGIANDGFWGIPVRPDTTYRVSFYARTDGAPAGPLAASIESNDGTRTFARAVVSGIGEGWQRFSATLRTAGDAPVSSANRFVLSTETPGTIWFNLVSLFPPTLNDRPNGNRIDLMEFMAGMKPRFLRFPGGNYLEGNWIATRFPWKDTLGDLATRPGHPGCWGYRSSDGLGLLEFLEWAEDLGAEPVLAIYAGYSLNGNYVRPGPDLQPYVDSAIEEIEYVTGDTGTKWGARRAADGHPAPFPLTWVEVGNEDNFDRSGTYDGRFTQFFDAIKAKYPRLKLISTINPESPAAEHVHSRTPDAVDEHDYSRADDFEREAPTHFEKLDRKGPKVFEGEWAAYEDVEPWKKASESLPPTSSMKAALGDAAWMTAMERNSDIVIMQCYAPMLVRVDPNADRAWRPDLIGFDSLNVFGSPTYYAFRMFSGNHGDTVVRTSLSGLPGGPVAALDCSATRDSGTGAIYAKVVNVTADPQPTTITVDGVPGLAASGRAITLAGRPDETNSIADPTHLVPVESEVPGIARSFTYTFPPYSVTVLQLPAPR